MRLILASVFALTTLSSSQAQESTKMERWSATITLEATSWEGLKSVSKDALSNITSARTWRDVSFGGGGNDGHDYAGYSIKISSPIAARVKDLRDEANKLEHEADKLEHAGQ